MTLDSILAQIDDEIARLTQARALLSATKAVASPKIAKVEAKAAAKPARRKKRVLSAEARKRIADSQHTRWAALKAKAQAK